MLFFFFLNLTTAVQTKESPDPQQAIRSAVRELVKAQDEDGHWPYDCVYREEDEEDGVPFGYRVASTSIIAQTLMFAAPDDKEARATVQNALSFVLKQLDHPKIATSTDKDRYDPRIWGQAFALEFLCHVRARKLAGKHTKEIDQWVPRLVKSIIKEEVAGGGWNYDGRRIAASFVTSSIIQALLWARAQGEKVSDKVFQRARQSLELARTEDGVFIYEDSADNPRIPRRRKRLDNSLPGSAGRAPLCETALVLLGGGSIPAVQSALENFYKHWDALEERRQQSGTHEGPHGIGPYYFYYGHRYVAQAIEMLPEKSRAQERERLRKTVLRTRDEDGTWNDREFERARYVGTAFAVMALLGDKVPLPPKWTKR